MILERGGTFVKLYIGSAGKFINVKKKYSGNLCFFHILSSHLVCIGRTKRISIHKK